MDLAHLRILLALKRQGTLVAAADTLYMTQSALSHQIKALEARLGTRLWRKQGRRLVLTEAGRYLTRVAEKIIPAVEQAEQHVRLLAAGQRGHFRIGIDCHACFQWLTRILKPFLGAWPALEVSVSSQYRFQSFDAIEDFKLDGVLTSDPEFSRGLGYLPLFDFRLLLMMARDHPLAHEPRIRPGQLEGQTILTYPVERDRLDIFNKVLSRHEIPIAAHKHVEETEIMLQMVAAHRGICLLPEWLLEDAGERLGLVGKAIEDTPLDKSMFLAVRPEDQNLDYIQWLVDNARGQDVVD
jgi:LysR family transcriptional regulator, regulator for metE and metH